jgi:hypothetical protein
VRSGACAEPQTPAGSAPAALNTAQHTLVLLRIQIQIQLVRESGSGIRIWFRTTKVTHKKKKKRLSGVLHYFCGAESFSLSIKDPHK